MWSITKVCLVTAVELANPRERIIAAARDLFHSRGFDATSVNDLIAVSQTHKASFYRYFTGKEAVAVEYLHRERDAFVNGLTQMMRRAADPSDFILTWNSLLMRQVKSNKFTGCRISRLMQTFSETDDTVQREAANVISCWVSLIAEYLSEQKLRRKFSGDAQRVAEKILRLFQGTAAMYRLHKKRDVFIYMQEDMLAELH